MECKRVKKKKSENWSKAEDIVCSTLCKKLNLHHNLDTYITTILKTPMKKGGVSKQACLPTACIAPPIQFFHAKSVTKNTMGIISGCSKQKNFIFCNPGASGGNFFHD